MITLEIEEPNKNEMRGNEGQKQNQNPPHFKIQHKDSDCDSYLFILVEINSNIIWFQVQVTNANFQCL